MANRPLVAGLAPVSCPIFPDGYPYDPQIRLRSPSIPALSVAPAVGRRYDSQGGLPPSPNRAVRLLVLTYSPFVGAYWARIGNAACEITSSEVSSRHCLSNRILPLRIATSLITPPMVDFLRMHTLRSPVIGGDPYCVEMRQCRATFRGPLSAYCLGELPSPIGRLASSFPAVS